MMTASHHFRVNALWTADDALGQRFLVDYQGHRCIVNLPAHEHDFGLDLDKALPGDVATGGHVGRHGEMLATSVLVVRVDVEMAGDLRADQFPREANIDRALVKKASLILKDAADIARNLISSLSAWVRVELGQYWLEPQHQRPEVMWLSELRDANGERIRVGYADAISVWGISDPEEAVTASDLTRVLDRVSNEEEPALAESFLSDALFYSWRAAHPNPQMGLILAAIATEINVKQVLSEIATADQRELVHLVIANPRDVTMAVSALFDKALEAVIGTSLRKDDVDLYKSVVRLFEHRNALAHRGERAFGEATIKEDLRTAQRVFKWLGCLRDRQGGDPSTATE
jgi:hypothetical protein